jgi:acyl-CoA dehydrogenase
MEKSKDDISAACNDYLKVLGLIAIAFSWLKILNVSYKELKNNNKFYEDKIKTAKFYFNRVLPRIDAYYNSAVSGSKYIMDFKFS